MNFDALVCDARAHYENFPVASLVLPKSMRRHVAAVYAFARAADDFADEGSLPDHTRHALLDGWLRRLEDAASTGGAGAPLVSGEPANTLEIFAALGATIRECELPVSLFADLVSAFRQDITTPRYASWDTLLDYCRRSANPVGRLVLRIAGCATADLDRASDAVCTALQLTNFWQDVALDLDRGRVYLPEETMRVHGARVENLGAGLTPIEWRRALADAASRTRAMFDAGRPVCDGVGGRLRYELRATWLGGVRILDGLAAADHDVVRRRPTIGAIDLPWFLWRLLTWR